MIQLITWNVGGLNNSIKRHRIWKYIKDYVLDHSQYSIIWMLQETHSTIESTKNWTFELGSQWKILSSNGKSNSNGVWTLSNNDVQLKQLLIDDIGRYQEIEITTNEGTFNVANIYAPSVRTNRPNWFLNLPWKKWEENDYIVGGDWNTVTEHSGKHSTKKDYTELIDSRTLIKQMTEYNMVDMWNIKGIGVCHTFIHRNGITSTRIDKWLAPISKISWIKKLEVITNVVESDHLPLIMELNLNLEEEKRGSASWTHKKNSPLT